MKIEFIYAVVKSCAVKNILCLPKTGEYIFNAIKDCGKNVEFYDNLEDAVKEAKKVTEKGTACLLSPAASSDGYFKNFEDRGRRFKSYVTNNN